MWSETLSGAKRRLLDLLKRRGPTTVGVLAQVLELTTVAVRQHLQGLEASGLVAAEKLSPRGRGRPSVAWSLTPQAAELYPDRHAELTAELIAAVREVFGDEGVERLIAVRARDQLALYRRLVPATGPLAARLAALARQRTAEGYMAEVVEEGPDSCLLIEHHCPICEAAQSCAGFCRSELDVFRSALGDGVEVERTRHLLGEGDRCIYRIKARKEGR